MRETLWLISACLLGYLALICGGVSFLGDLAGLSWLDQAAFAVGLLCIIGVIACARKA